MAGAQLHRPAGRRLVYTAAAVAAAALLVGVGAAVRDIAQARSLIWSQRSRLYLRLLEPGYSAELAQMTRMKPDRLEVRPGDRPGERIEIWTFGPARVTIRFTPAAPQGVVIDSYDRLPPMAWSPGRGPRETRGNLGPASVVPYAVACRAPRH